MTTWSLPELLAGLHHDIERQLGDARKLLGHPVEKGDGTEAVWIEFFNTYLPQRYRADKAVVVDATGAFSEQIDVVLYDRQYSPFIFKFKGTKVIPAESVYAVFECKQSLDLGIVDYAHHKIESVRKLSRTSLPIPTAAGEVPAKRLHHIIGGLLTFESDWNPPLGPSLNKALTQSTPGSIDIGCVAARGYYTRQTDGSYQYHPEGKPATAFLFELLARLQAIATVPMVDIRAYAKWLA